MLSAKVRQVELDTARLSVVSFWFPLIKSNVIKFDNIHKITTIKIPQSLPHKIKFEITKHYISFLNSFTKFQQRNELGESHHSQPVRKNMTWSFFYLGGGNVSG